MSAIGPKQCFASGIRASITDVEKFHRNSAIDRLMQPLKSRARHSAAILRGGERRLIEMRLSSFETHDSKGESGEGEGAPNSVGASEALASAKAEIARLTEKNRAREEENAGLRRQLDSLTKSPHEERPTDEPTETSVDIGEDSDNRDDQWNPYNAISDDSGIDEDVSDYIRKKALERTHPYFIRRASRRGDTWYFYFFAQVGGGGFGE